jgi:hypothetical protein
MGCLEAGFMGIVGGKACSILPRPELIWDILIWDIIE